MMNQNETIPVALAKCAEYDDPKLDDTVALLLDAIECRPTAGTKILVKPNLLAATPPDYLPCSHPAVVRAVCRRLLDLGAEVRVGDSPTFGNGAETARKIGLTKALSDLPVPIVKLDRPKWKRLSFGPIVPISGAVLSADLIVSVPKLKAHHQTRITGAVKNVYGCVPGLRKPVLHLMYGDWGSCFERMLLELWQELPPSFSLMDAVTAMHVHGPNNGQPYDLGLLAASRSPIALDSAVMHLLGLHPAQAPLWKTAERLGLPGSRLDDLTFPLEEPGCFSAAGFETPELLFPISFRPLPTLAHFIKKSRRTALASSRFRGHQT